MLGDVPLKLGGDRMDDRAEQLDACDERQGERHSEHDRQQRDHGEPHVQHLCD